MDRTILTQLIKTAPTASGVYFWRDQRGRPLYIGKALNLRNRLTSYPKTLEPRIRHMVESAKKLDWQTTPTDIEALILESQLIKRYHPKYNVEWRDDKQYSYVAVTDEDFPQLLATHQANNSKIKKPIRTLIGPFTDAAALKATLRLLRSLFPFCTCKQKHYVRCLNAHIGKCPGFCCLKEKASAIQRREYKKNIRAITNILTGKRDTLIRTMEKEMKATGQRHELERALVLQRQIERIRRIFQNAKINTSRIRNAARHHGALAQIQELLGLNDIPQRIEGYDIANMMGDHRVGSLVVFTMGKADTAENRLFNVRTTTGGDTAMLEEVLQRRLNHAEWPLPQLILVDGGKGQLNTALRVLDSRGIDIPVIALTKNEKHQGDHIFSSIDGRVHYLKDLPRPVRDLIIHIDSEAHRFAISRYRRQHRKKLLT